MPYSKGGAELCCPLCHPPSPHALRYNCAELLTPFASDPPPSLLSNVEAFVQTRRAVDG